MARRFLHHGIEMLRADVVNEQTLPICRHRWPDVIVVRLSVEFSEAQRARHSPRVA